MRRTIFLALLAAVLIAPAAARATPPLEIQRDCADDDVLQGNYSVSDLRRARSELPTDADEYSACRDVLTRAITKATAASKTPTPTATADSSGGGGTTGNGGGGGGGGSTGDSSGGSTPDTSQEEQDAAILAAPSSPQDAQAVGAAEANGEKAIKAELVVRDPGNARLAASVGRNGLPTTMIAVLVLLAATLVAAFVPLIRRRRVFPFRPRT